MLLPRRTHSTPPPISPLTLASNSPPRIARYGTPSPHHRVFPQTVTQPECGPQSASLRRLPTSPSPLIKLIQPNIVWAVLLLFPHRFYRVLTRRPRMGDFVCPPTFNPPLKIINSPIRPRLDDPTLTTPSAHSPDFPSLHRANSSAEPHTPHVCQELTSTPALPPSLTPHCQEAYAAGPRHLSSQYHSPDSRNAASPTASNRPPRRPDAFALI
ncbi:hypothetical protein R3P38DRAFT_3164770 [Favolaschia claudopus]|uniref:Uncharacterized protein n=1 Tax=Favolaschia claudopus TaxID=2862362 RepID=A0AAW0EE45_9AGAR